MRLLPVVCSWFERLTMTVILVNCVTLGMYEPCPDVKELVCDRNCQILKVVFNKYFLKYAHGIGSLWKNVVMVAEVNQTRVRRELIY